jgi:MFS family permease
VFWGGWAVAAADVERDLRLGHGGFGLLLSAALAAAALSNAFGGAFAERHGTVRVLGFAFGAWSVLLVSMVFVREPLVMGALVVVAIAAGGVVDVVMNVAATAGLAGDPGGLVRFHGRFNLGAAVGAATMGLVRVGGGSWRWGWLLAGVGGAVLAWSFLRLPLGALPAGEAGESVGFGSVLTLLRRQRLVVVALAFALGSMVEGGVELWGVLFLRTSWSRGLTLGAGSAVAGYLVAMTARIVLGPYAGRRGPVVGVAFGAGAAAVGTVVLAWSPVAVVAGGGLVLAAGGISLCWPLLLALAASGSGADRPGAVVGAVTSVGYLGFVVGPSLVGLLAGRFGLRAGLLVLAVAAVFVAVAPALRRA